MTASSLIKVNTESFKKWMTTTLSVMKTDTLFKGWMAAIRVVKKKLSLKNRMPKIGLMKK